MKTIAIIGGGFSGTMAAVNLARFAEAPLHVSLINHGFPLGRGVAYGTQRPEHLLNVAARNMSALADHPNHFLDWLRTRSEYADLAESALRETFVPRRIYGDYLRALLLWYARPLGDRPAVRVETIAGEAVDVAQRRQGAAVLLADGASIEADKVLLATGNQPPAKLPSPAAPFEHPRYCASPWEDWQARLPDRRETVVLLGTGLTSVDAFLTLAALDWQGPIVAVSRHGLLPQSHFKGIDYPDFPPGDPSTLGLTALLELMEEHCGRLRQRAANPAIVVDRLRPHTQRIWQNFSLAEKHEFFTRHAARWNVARHRIAQDVYRQLSAALASGGLRVVKGRLGDLQSAGDRIRVRVEGVAGPTEIEAGLVINCTGPQASFSAADSPLFRSLLAKGLVAVDEMDMGLQVDADFAVVDRAGRPSDFLFAIGPLLRGALWESVAVPELRGQALRVAQTLLRQGAPWPSMQPWSAPAEMYVLEYCI